MRILLVHNFYQQPGGEDQVFAAEAELLRSYGHSVREFTLHNDQVAQLGRVALAEKTVWNRDAYRQLRAECRAYQPRIVHFHNTFPLVSPAAYYAARREGAAVVQTLHNYRLLCPGTNFFRDGKACQDCLGRAFPWPGILHACYRDSRSATIGAAVSVAAHRMARTWTRAVDLYIAPTEFVRRKYVEGGMPPSKVIRKPHFLPDDPGIGKHGGGYALFVGRLSAEKGIERLVRAWDQLERPVPLRVVGDGPLAPLVRSSSPHLHFLGQQTRTEVLEAMRNAAFLVFPSECYETFGLTIVEAFATGLPVVASNLGSAGELVRHGETGVHFRAGDTGELAAAVDWAIGHPQEIASMGMQARTEYLAKYTAERNYQDLMDSYHVAIRQRDPHPDFSALASSGVMSVPNEQDP
jgi:glycosyltransferase involved in cell wall biosynthesis